MAGLFGSPQVSAAQAPVILPPPAATPPAPMPAPDPEARKRVAEREMATRVAKSTTRRSTIIGDNDELGA